MILRKILDENKVNLVDFSSSTPVPVDCMIMGRNSVLLWMGRDIARNRASIHISWIREKRPKNRNPR